MLASTKLSVSKLSQRGAAHLLIPLILLVGIATGVYLVSTGNLKLFSKASNPPIVFKSTDGKALPTNANGIPQTTSPMIKIELTSTLGAPVFATPTPTPATTDDGKVKTDIDNIAKAIEKSMDANLAYNFPTKDAQAFMSGYVPYKSPQGYFCVKLNFDNASVPLSLESNWAGQDCKNDYLVFGDAMANAQERRYAPNPLPKGVSIAPANKSFLNVKSWTICAPLGQSPKPYCVSSKSTSPLVSSCDTLWKAILGGNGSQCGSPAYITNKAGDIDNNGIIDISDQNDFVSLTKEGSDAEACKRLLEDTVDPCAAKAAPAPASKDTPAATSASSPVGVGSSGRTLGIATQIQTAGTVSYKIAENPTDLDKATAIPYTTHPTVTDYTFKTPYPGTKFIWVEFKDVSGKTDRKTAQIEMAVPASATPTPKPTPQAFTCTACSADVKKDGSVNGGDVSYLIGCYNKLSADKDRSGKSCADRDINGDGVIKGEDFSCIRTVFNQKCEANTISKRVFITDTVYTGNLGGLSGADAKCQSRADAASLGGTWKAWLSDRSTSATARMRGVAGPYKRTDGVIIAQNWDELLKYGPRGGITTSETGNLQTQQNVWTNTLNTGAAAQTQGDKTCFGWLTNNSSFSGSGGNSSMRTSSISWTTGVTSPCNRQQRLYCIEQ